MSKEPVNIIVDRTVRKGMKGELEPLLDGIIKACAQFPGYIDTRVKKPESDEDHRYQILFRFASQKNLEMWARSKERLFWIEQIDKFIEKPTQLQVITGLETWFSLPGQTTITPPPRYKMAAATWLAITPLLIFVNYLFGSLLIQFPLVPRFIISTPGIVLFMTYFWMPLVTKIFRGWLYPSNPS